MTGLTPKEPGQEEKPQPSSSEGGWLNFFKEHMWESISYLVLFFGLIFTIFYQNIGGFIVGLIFGGYFAAQIKERVVVFKEFIDQEGIFRSFIMIAAIIALLIVALGLCIGTALGAIVRPYLQFGNKD